MKPQFCPTVISRVAAMQREHIEWELLNFGTQESYIPLMGVVEEVGEAFRPIIKTIQGIRGDRDKHIADLKDAIGDILVWLVSWCNKNGVDFSETLLHSQAPSGQDVEWQMHFGAFAIVRELSALCTSHVTGMHHGFKCMAAYNFWFAVEHFSQTYLQESSLELLLSTWGGVVKARDWRANPATGVPA